MQNRIYYLYKLVSPNNKVYIGQTINLNKRFSSYRNLLCNQQTLLYNSIKKYGWSNFKKEIVFDGICDKKEIDRLEIFYIKKYKLNKISLNIADGGHSGILLKGKYHPNSIPIYQCDLSGNILFKWDTIIDAAKSINKEPSAIGEACRKNSFYAYNYLWCKVEEYDKPKLQQYKTRIHPLSKKVLKIALNGTVISIYDNARLASEDVNTSVGNILSCTSNKKITAAGYFWIKESDYSEEKIKMLQERKKINIKKKAVNMFSKDNLLINKFDSITEASKTLGICKTHIIRQCKGKVKNPHKYIFKYAK